MVFQCDCRIVILARLSGGQDFLLQLVAARLGRERHGFPNLLQGQCIADAVRAEQQRVLDRKSTRLNSSHVSISYAVFCLKKKNQEPKTVVADPPQESSDR